MPTFDEETRAALLQLLQDETVVPPNQWGGTEGSVADATAATLLMPRWKAESSAKMGQLGESAGQVLRAWMLKRAWAMAGEPLPPIPDASRVPKEDAERLAQEIAAHPAAVCRKLCSAKHPTSKSRSSRTFAI